MFCTLTIDELIYAIERKNGYPLDIPQKDAIRHGQGPLWIIAGPGTGKTETLIIRCLKLICCDGVDPGSIIVTTFTEKATRNLEDRLLSSMLYLVDLYPNLGLVDISRIRIGTLHSLCNEIMQEYRYQPYQNLRLLDEVESKMLIRKHLAWNFFRRNTRLKQQCIYLFNNPAFQSLWDWTKALQKIINRVIEDQININSLRNAGGPWVEAANTYDLYVQTLREQHSCDFAHLQKYFLDFLLSRQASPFINGDAQHPPLLYVLVDEYQDSNPIQEEIYFSLAISPPHNLTIVGDDDQALYRFRGGTVDCMLDFEDRCQRTWQITPTKIILEDNHRSDERIVSWCNDYITSFPIMAQTRIPNKRLVPHLGTRGNHPAVSIIRQNNGQRLAQSFADTVYGLLSNGIIQDYSQCVLLVRSTKNSPNNAGKFITALENRGIPIYNPRSKSYLDQSEIQEALGALISIIDPLLTHIHPQSDLRPMITNWLQAYTTMSGNFTNLSHYVSQSQISIQGMGTNIRITSAFPSIIYRILSHDPFSSYQTDPEQDLRLSKLTRLIEAFCSQHGRPLYTDNQVIGTVNLNWLQNFYDIFCGYLESHGIDDDEDEEVICPLGKIPIMTIHQSKGLEFDFVFVDSLGHSVSPSDSIYLENDLMPFRTHHPHITNTATISAWQDDIRLHYVAYSRAKYGLVLLASDAQLRKNGLETASFGGQGGPWFRQNYRRL